MLKFSPPPTDSPPAEESEYSVFATASARSVAAPALWSRDRVARKACAVDDRRMVKDAGSFGDSTLPLFFPLVEEDETLLKILEIDAEVIEYLRSTYKLDWDPAKPFGAKPKMATEEAEQFLNKWSRHQLSSRVSPFTCREPKGLSLRQSLIGKKNVQPCSKDCLLHLYLSAWWMKHWLAPCLWQIT